MHENIIESSPQKHEVPAGWLVHYLIGAGVALTYPLLYVALNEPMPVNHLLNGALWGLATTFLPWLTNFPAFGWGFFGVRSPKGSRPIMAPAIAHACYGLGVGIVFTLTVGGY